MPMNVTQKIIAAHRVSGEMTPGAEIALRIDQTLTQDATGTMAYLQFEAMGVPRVRTDLSVSFVDHNTLQMGFRNPDDHIYLRTVAARYGIVFSPPGTGICHQLHLENFAKPGATLIGSDSHTPTAGGVGSLAMGAGGLSVALAMAGEPYVIAMPSVVKVWLTGELTGWATAKDVILHVLGELTVKGGVGKVMEYCGPGAASLTVPERATITNMGAELGATTSVFPSDGQTRAFLAAMGREEDFTELLPDQDATYDEELVVDLSSLEPLAAAPHMPDRRVHRARAGGHEGGHQAAIGSCTNSSYADLKTVALMLKGKRISTDSDLMVSPGSKHVLSILAAEGLMEPILASGGRLLECTCGPCIGMGGSPPSAGVSVRTFNRNFEGRSGTQDAQVYLASPQTAAMAALQRRVHRPRVTLGNSSGQARPARQSAGHAGTCSSIPDGRRRLRPWRWCAAEHRAPGAIRRTARHGAGHGGPQGGRRHHHRPYPARGAPRSRPCVPISRPSASTSCSRVDQDFTARIKALGGGVVVGGENYGQGSSREHAALGPRHLGVAAVLVKSLARIHRANLVNFGILPLFFEDKADYDRVAQGASVRIPARDITPGGTVRAEVEGLGPVALTNDLTAKELDIIRAGGLLNAVRKARA